MFINVNGADIYYEIMGQGPNVLTLHGGPGIGDHGDNKKMFQRMQDRFRFVYFDFRGNGKSEETPPETYTHEQYVEDTEAMRQSLELGKCALSGGSYGGIIALEYALKYQDRISCMILRGTAASFELQNYAFENAMNSGLPGVNEDMLHNLFYGKMKSDQEFKEHFAKIYPLYSKTYTPEKAKELFDRKRFIAATHNAFFRHAFPKYDIRERLHEIEIPVLILAGRHDWITPMKLARELEDNIPNAELIIFENAGHSIHSDEPDKFYGETERFLNEHTERAGG